MLVGDFDCFPAVHRGDSLALALAHPPNNLLLRFDSLCGGELATGNMPALDCLELSSREPGIQIAANLAICDLSHAAAKGVSYERPFVDYSFPLEVLVP